MATIKIKQKRTKAKGKQLEALFIKTLDELARFKKLKYLRLNVDKRREPADFLIITSREIWFIDTKETGSTKFYWNKSDSLKNQIKEMQEYQTLGHRAGFVIWFTELDPIRQNMRFISEFDKPVTIESGELFSWDKFWQL